MAHRGRRIPRAIAAAAALSLLPGCVFVGPRSIVRGWADWATYGQWSVCLDRRDHLPPRRPRVEMMLWQYGAGPTGRRCSEGRHCGAGGCAAGAECESATIGSTASPSIGPTPADPPATAEVPTIVPTSGVRDAEGRGSSAPRGAWLFGR